MSEYSANDIIKETREMILYTKRGIAWDRNEKGLIKVSKDIFMDRHTPEQRRRNMQAIKNKDSKIELLLRQELWQRGLRYRKNVNTIYGHPDIAFIGKKVAIFCDSEFWHGYDWENRKETIHTRREFWIPKIERNIERDLVVTKTLEQDGWIVLRFWGNEILKNCKGCADSVQNVLKER